MATLTDGERLQRWREFRGMTRAEFARKCGVSRQTVEGWEIHDWAPRWAHQVKISAVLGLPRPVRVPLLPEPPPAQHHGGAA